MTERKTKDVKSKKVKTLDKTVVWTEKVKAPIINLKEKTNDTADGQVNVLDYGEDKIKYASNCAKDEAIYAGKKVGNYGKDKVVNHAKKKYQKKQLIKEKNKDIKGTVEKTKKSIKTSKKNTEKAVKENARASKRVLEQGKKLVIERAKRTAESTKNAIKATISSIKAIITGVKSLIGILTAGSSVAVIAVVIICLVGLLVTSIFGIFFSSEKTSTNGITMRDVITECNQDFSDKLETIQNQNTHDVYVLEGNTALWRDILLIYAVKQSNGVNEQEVITLDDNKKAIVKQIFWDMNEISYEVKTETVETSKVDTSDTTTSQEKKVLHIYVKSKTADEMKSRYNFNAVQLKQYNELSSEKYASLWNGVIYGFLDSGEYISWRQRDPQWANVKMGNSSGTIGSIGCLVTSVSILIEKSGVNTTIKPFNPGTFVEALNKNGGFDSYGNLQYAAISKAVPGFKYVGKVNLRNKTREEKLSLIKQYLNAGYYITVEVKGATPGNQHWVAVINVEGNSVIMVDPGTNQTNMWNAYNHSKTSQFNYFKVEG